MKCKSCGADIDADSVFCPFCGVKQIPVEPDMEGRHDSLNPEQDVDIDAGNQNEPVQNVPNPEENSQNTDESSNMGKESPKDDMSSSWFDLSPSSDTADKNDDVLGSGVRFRMNDDTGHDIPENEEKPSEPVRHHTGMIIGIVAAAVVVAALIVILIAVLSTPKQTTIDLNDYVDIVTAGYDGDGTASVYLDAERLREDYDGKLELTDKGKGNLLIGMMTARGMDPIDIVISDVSVSLSEDMGLSNGDTISVVWNMNTIESTEEYVDVKLNAENFEYTIDDLRTGSTGDGVSTVQYDESVFNSIVFR